MSRGRPPVDRGEESPGADDDSAPERHALYYSPWCGYCLRVLALIKTRDLDVECRNARSEPVYRQELVTATGRSTVPVLRVTPADGGERWLAESGAIVRYLREHGRPRRRGAPA